MSTLWRSTSMQRKSKALLDEQLAEYRAKLSRVETLEFDSKIERMRRENSESAFLELLNRLGQEVIFAPVKFQMDNPMMYNGNLITHYVTATPFLSEEGSISC